MLKLKETKKYYELFFDTEKDLHDMLKLKLNKVKKCSIIKKGIYVNSFVLNPLDFQNQIKKYCMS